jgi:arabinogalactan oligomer / maltooligosaccharide transport system substrate-binding protein
VCQNALKPASVVWRSLRKTNGRHRVEESFVKKRTVRSIAAAVVAITGAAVASASLPAAAQDATTTIAPTTTKAPVKRADADLVIWADDSRTKVLEPIAAQFAADEGIKVAVQQLKYDEIRDQLKLAGPAGQGPDIVVGAHDWLGELATSGLVAPLDLGAKAKNFQPVAIKGFTYNGKIYGLPYAVENIGLIRNTQLVPKAPKTWAEVEKTALALKKSGKVDVALAVQQNGTADPYHMYPLFSALGGYVFKADASGTYDPNNLGIDSKAGLEAAKQFRKWIDSGLIDPNITYDVMIKSFAEGKAAYAITGPWAVTDPEKGFKVKGTPYVVEAFPPVKTGIKPAVFVGVQGFMVSSFSKQQALAKTFVTDYLGSKETQLALFKAGGRPPALTAAFNDPAVKNDKDVRGFGLAAANGQPQPAIPAMGSVWGSWTDAYKLIFTKQGTPEQAFKDAAAKIRTDIAAKK